MSLKFLGSPIKLGARTAPNRFLIHPVECNDSDDKGAPTELTLERYKNLARGGAGVIMVESLTIDYTCRSRKNQLLLDASTKEAMTSLVDMIKAESPEAIVILQLNHSGRASDPEFSRLVSAYIEEPGVELLTTQDILNLQELYAEAAVISKQCGADGVDFKFCHGFLLGEFLRPLNQRDDQYGGSWENRSRFFVETARKMKTAVNDPDFLFGVRYSIYEAMSGGFGTAGPEQAIEDLSEPIAFAKLIEQEGFSWISITAGDVMTTLNLLCPGDDFPQLVLMHQNWTKQIKQAVNIPVVGAAYSYLRNGKNELHLHDKSFLYWAEKNLAEGAADFIGIGRQSLADPLLPQKVLAGDTAKIKWCQTCGGCGALLGAQQEVGCVLFNPHHRKLYRQLKKDGVIE